MAKQQDDKKKPTKASKKKTSANRDKRQQLKDILVQVDEHDGLKRCIGSLQEQVNSYVLIGYSFNGTPVTAVAATTPQEYDALYQRVQNFLQQKPPAIVFQSLDSPPPSE